MSARQRIQWCRTVWGLLLALGLLSGRCSNAAIEPNPEIRFRVRITRLTPEQPARILFRWGGEGLGGNVQRGEMTRRLAEVPDAVENVEDVLLAPAGDDLSGIGLEKDGNRPDRVIERDHTYDYHYLYPGTWSRWVPLSEVPSGFITFTLRGHETGDRLTDCELEFFFRYGEDDPVKQFRVAGPEGPSFGLHVPHGLLQGDGKPSSAFVEQLGGLLHYERWKSNKLKALPWSDRPTPRRYMMSAQCLGYGAGAGYGIRTADRNTVLAALDVLALLGMNSIRQCPEFVMDMIRKREGIGSQFTRAKLTFTTDYPIPLVQEKNNLPPVIPEGAGCPYLPANAAGVEERSARAAAALLREYADAGFDEIWALTNDEIGTVYEHAPEGQEHMGACPWCREAFREMVRNEGRTLEDFGAGSWEHVRSIRGYWALDYWESKRILEKRLAEAKKARDAYLEGQAAAGLDQGMGASPDGQDLVDALLGELRRQPSPEELAERVLAAEARLRDLVWERKILHVPEDQREDHLSKAGWDLLKYYTRRFRCVSAARLFQPLQQALGQHNRAHREALERCGQDSPAARQPDIYSYALRGDTLVRGHNLDYFNFYRYADNAIVYETTHAHPRAWQWDSYLCDAARSVHRFMGKRFGIYIKPINGAPIQRCLTAVARGVRLVHWYTYGPDWAKVHSFGGNLEQLEAVGRVTRMVAAVEDVIYDSEWAVPAEVAFVRPRTSEFLDKESWLNGKWVYTGLLHAHIPVDALNEGLLVSEDLSGYKAVVVAGSHIRRDAARKLRQYVAEGGTLYTCGWGLARDESSQPLDSLLPVLGLKSRAAPESPKEKGAGPVTAEIVGVEAFPSDGFPLAYPREILDPAEDTFVAARYRQGGAALTRSRYGKGTAWVAGFYPGFEYSSDEEYSPIKRAFMSVPLREAGVCPVVDADQPEVEGVLLRNREDGRQAVVLINWQDRFERPVTIRLRGVEGAKTVFSTALQQAFELEEVTDGAVAVLLPRIDAGDILLLE